MACELATVQADACTSNIGRLNDRIQLLQVAAQAALNWAEANNPGVEYTVESILDRACDSGIGRVSDRLTLLRLWLQNLCNIQ